MSWTGDESRNFLRDQGSKVQNTQRMDAEAVNLNYGYTDPTLNDATARNNIGYIGGHLYGTRTRGPTARLLGPRCTPLIHTSPFSYLCDYGRTVRGIG